MTLEATGSCGDRYEWPYVTDDRTHSVVATGLATCCNRVSYPSSELLGYSRKSLRDRPWVPEGPSENSPAIDRWVGGRQHPMSPGRDD